MLFHCLHGRFAIKSAVHQDRLDSRRHDRADGRDHRQEFALDRYIAVLALAAEHGIYRADEMLTALLREGHAPMPEAVTRQLSQPDDQSVATLVGLEPHLGPYDELLEEVGL